jgi:hypothetical protein
MERISDWKPFEGLKKLGFDFDKMKSSRITKNINKESRLLAK